MSGQDKTTSSAKGLWAGHWVYLIINLISLQKPVYRVTFNPSITEQALYKSTSAMTKEKACTNFTGGTLKVHIKYIHEDIVNKQNMNMIDRKQNTIRFKWLKITGSTHLKLQKRESAKAAFVTFWQLRRRLLNGCKLLWQLCPISI